MVDISRRTLLKTAVGGMTVALAGCGGGGDTSEDSGTITIAVVETATINFDPALNDVNATYQLAPIYDTLIRQTSSGDFEPNVATSWEYVTATQFVMRIRSDVTFSDGTTLDADAVRRNIEAVKAKGGPFAGTLANVSAVTAPDATTVQIDLSTPYPTLPAVFSGMAGMLVSPSVIDSDTLSTQPIGSGPYTLTESSPGQQYTYAKRSDYWNADHYHYDNVVLLVFADAQSKLNALQSGQVDVIEYEADSTIRALADAGTVRFSAAPYNVDFLMLMDQGGVMSPPLKDVRVRQAMNYAIDRDAIANLLGEGNGEPTAQLFKPDQPGYDAEFDARYPYDPDKARQLLVEAGYPDGFSLPMVSLAYFDQPAQAAAGYLSEVGITIETTNVPIGQFATSIASKDYPTAFYAYNMTDTYTDMSGIVGASGFLNPFGTDDPSVTSALATAASATDTDQLEQAMTAVNSAVTENAWFVPLFYNIFGIADNGTVAGIEFQVIRPPALYDWKPED